MQGQSNVEWWCDRWMQRDSHGVSRYMQCDGGGTVNQDDSRLGCSCVGSMSV